MGGCTGVHAIKNLFASKSVECCTRKLKESKKRREHKQTKQNHKARDTVIHAPLRKVAKRTNASLLAVTPLLVTPSALERDREARYIGPRNGRHNAPGTRASGDYNSRDFGECAQILMQMSFSNRSVCAMRTCILTYISFYIPCIPCILLSLTFDSP